MSSTEENRIVQWLLGIAGTLAAAGIVGGVILYAQMQVGLEQIKFMRADMQKIFENYERMVRVDSEHTIRLTVLERYLTDRVKEDRK